MNPKQNIVQRAISNIRSTADRLFQTAQSSLASQGISTPQQFANKVFSPQAFQQTVAKPYQNTPISFPANYVANKGANILSAAQAPFNNKPLLQKAGDVIGGVGTVFKPMQTASFEAMSPVFQTAGNLITKRKLPTLNELKTGFYESQKTAPKIAAISAVTNPLIEKTVGKIAPLVKSPTGQLVLNRASTGALNIPEGMAMNAASGNPYSVGQAATDFAMGALTGSQPTGKIRVKGARATIDPQTLNEVDTLRDALNRAIKGENMDLKRVTQDVDVIASKWLDKADIAKISAQTKNKQPAVYYRNLLDTIAKKVGEYNPRYGGFQMGIKSNISPDRAAVEQNLNPTQKDLGRAMIGSVQEDMGKPEPLPWELNANPKQEQLPTLPTDKSAQYSASLKGGGFDTISTSAKEDFAKWVNTRRASESEGILIARNFSKYDAEGIDGLLKSQAKDTKGNYADVRKYFDDKYKTLQKEGINFNYKQEYLPQLWANSEEEVAKVFGNRLNTKPSFTYDSVIKDYKEGIAKGLTPKYSKVSDLVRWYESKANKAIADKQYFNAIAKEGLIQPSGKAPREWVSLDPDRFPKIKVKIDGIKEYQGVYKAPKDLANMINNYLYSPEQGSDMSRILARIADYTSGAKNRMLSFGVPGTGINAHGFNILARNILASKNPIEGAVTGIRYMINPYQAAEALDRQLTKAPFAIKNGLTLGTSEYTSSLEAPEGFRGKFGQKWNDLFEKSLFDRMIPALKLKKYYEVFEGYKKSMPEQQAAREAAKFTNNVFGGINWEELGKSRDMQNVKRAVILAPDWLQSNINLGKEIGKSFYNFKDPKGQAYRRFAATFLGSYVTMNVVNKMSSGHFMYENDPGHEFEIEAGYTNDGQKRYIRPFGTGADFVRLPTDIIVALAKGDLSAPTRIIRNRLSAPLGGALGLLMDTNYKGQPVGVRGTDKYGNQMSIPQRVSGIGGELGSIVGVPSFLGNMTDYATGKQGTEQAITQGFELPFRYSGNSNNASKQVAPLVDAKGKDLYDLNKALQGQDKFSNKQLRTISESEDGLQKVLDERKKRSEETKLDNEAKLKLEQSGENILKTNNKIYYKNELGDTTSVNLAIEKPTFTNNAKENEKIRSTYVASITRKQNALKDLYISKDISQAEFSKYMGQLGSAKYPYLKASTKKGRRGKIKIPKLKKVKIRKPKKIKVKNVKLKRFKLLDTTKRSLQSKRAD